MINKITSIENLKKIIFKLKSKKKRIVLCHGVFDLLHIGHIKHFNEAGKYGDILVVTLTPDAYVDKGPKRPAFSEKLRLESIASLDVVDYVALNSSPTAISAIKKIKPNIYCKGPDYKDHKNDISGQIKNEIKEFVEERDWEQFHTPKNLSMALSVEASELLEIFQWQKEEEHKNATEKEKEMIKDEIADILYYLVRISEKLNINIEEAFFNKMKKNREKYPKESVKGKAIKN